MLMPCAAHETTETHRLSYRRSIAQLMARQRNPDKGSMVQRYVRQTTMICEVHFATDRRWVGHWSLSARALAQRSLTRKRKTFSSIEVTTVALLFMSPRVLLLILFSMASEDLAAQQNFFNVPSSEITEDGKIFLQQQFNLYGRSSVSNSTFCFGLGHEAEIGFNLLGITYSNSAGRFVSSAEGEEPVFPSFGINAQKQIEISEHYQISAGGQLLLPKKVSEYEWYGYLNNRVHAGHLKIVFGLFSGNINYFDSEPLLPGSSVRLGVQAGLEYEVLTDRLYLQSDYISGRTAVSNLIVGAAYKATSHLILSAGYQSPNSTVTSSTGLVIEFTYVE